MPKFGGFRNSVASSKINFDADLTIPAAYKLKADHIAETTASHGVELDNVGTGTRQAMMVYGGGQ